MKSIFVLSQSIDHYILLLLEGLVLALILLAFWHHTAPETPIRANWLWLLWFAVPIFWLRLRIHGRLWIETPLNNLLIAFILLTAFNFANAPYHREGFLIVTARPFFGIWLYLYFLEVANLTKRLTPLLIATIGMAFVLALLALTATQWLPDKSGDMNFIIEHLPHFDYRLAGNQLNGSICFPLVDVLMSTSCFNPGDIMRNSLFSFNPNEIAGALAWVTPVVAALALGYRSEDNKTGSNGRRKALRLTALVVFLMLFLALFLGQSRFAIFGVIISLTLLTWILVAKGTWRYAALMLIGLIILIQFAILLNLFHLDAADEGDSANAGLTARDQNSVSTRLQIWQRGLWMMWDYPTTGVGMAMFRTAVNRPPYQIPYYVETGQFPPPHAHNEWIQMGADLGIPGLLLYLAWQGVVLYMLHYGWRNGDKAVQLVAIATFAGLFAHAAYALGDAVTLWDRYQFILWWLVGLAGAQYVIARQQVDLMFHQMDEA